MPKPHQKDGRCRRIARRILGLLLHGTGAAFIATGRLMEVCGESLQVIAEGLRRSSRCRAMRGAS